MSRCNTLKYHYFYKITNNINGHFYYGVHNTNNINDGYMGSGTRLHYAYKKYGIENFSKEILKYFESSDDAFQYESEIVTEDLIFNPDCYNLVKGGIGWNNEGLVAVKDNITGKCIHVSKNDPRYLNGELKGITYGLVTCKDKDNNVLQVDKHDIRLNDGTYTYIHKGKSLYKDEKGNTYFLCTDDERIKKLNLVSFSKGMRTMRDKNNNYFYVDVNDERIKTGELYSLWKDRKHTEETKQKLKNTFKKNHHQQGVKNSQYGTCWVYKYVDEKNIQNKKIKKEDKELYLLNGWYSGRKIKI